MSPERAVPRPPAAVGTGRNWLFLPGLGLVNLLLKLAGGASVEGREHVPRIGPVLVVSNHVSDLDPPIVGWAVGLPTRRVFHFMAKEEMRKWPVLGPLLAEAGTFYIRRGEGDRAAQRHALALLDGGHPVAVFPEGHRSRDGKLQEGKLGVALLAMRSGVPLLPVAVTGSDKILPPGGRRLRRSHVMVRIGPTFQLAHRPRGRLDRAELENGRDTVMRRIAELLPEERRGPYR